VIAHSLPLIQIVPTTDHMFAVLVQLKFKPGYVCLINASESKDLMLSKFGGESNPAHCIVIEGDPDVHD